jgi:hypothetical protein|tara:strand:+ start:444 stop:566 length:123 start_codon:yes stop_codon:yes gene_type:complete
MTIATFISGYFLAALGWAMFWAIKMTAQSIINLKYLNVRN